MVHFFGRSKETHHMKGKPICNGYKCFVLALKNGYVINFTPLGQQQMKQISKSTKLMAVLEQVEIKIIIFVLKVIDTLKEKEIKKIEMGKVNTRK